MPDKRSATRPPRILINILHRHPGGQARDVCKHYFVISAIRSTGGDLHPRRPPDVALSCAFTQIHANHIYRHPPGQSTSRPLTSTGVPAPLVGSHRHTPSPPRPVRVAPTTPCPRQPPVRPLLWLTHRDQTGGWRHHRLKPKSGSSWFVLQRRYVPYK